MPVVMTPEEREFAHAHVVEVFLDEGGGWRWRRKARGNHAIDSTSGEDFDSQANAERAARTANPYMEVVLIRPDQPVNPAPDVEGKPLRPTTTDGHGDIAAVETKPRKPTTTRTTSAAKKPATRKRKTTAKRKSTAKRTT